MKNNMLEKLEAYLESEEGKASLDKWALEMKLGQEHHQRWSEKIAKRLKDATDLDELYEKYNKHSDKRRDILWKNGIDGDTSLSFVILDAFSVLGREVLHELQDAYFTTEAYEYMGYRTERLDGQGSFVLVSKV